MKHLLLRHMKRDKSKYYLIYFYAKLKGKRKFYDFLFFLTVCIQMHNAFYQLRPLKFQ